ncbi:hypothetical protein D3C72_929270 [compost metagenome]
MVFLDADEGARDAVGGQKPDAPGQLWVRAAVGPGRPVEGVVAEQADVDGGEGHAGVRPEGVGVADRLDLARDARRLVHMGGLAGLGQVAAAEALEGPVPHAVAEQSRRDGAGPRRLDRLVLAGGGLIEGRCGRRVGRRA